MSVSNGIITAPVSIDDVNNVLGHGSTDLGTLCQSSKIKPWAKYKPVSVKTYKEIGGTPYNNDTSLAASENDSGNEQYYQFNLKIPHFTLSTLIDGLYFKHIPVKANNGYFYRLLDFNGYDNSATKPEIYIVFPTSIYYNFTQSIRITPYAESNKNVISLSDFKIKTTTQSGSTSKPLDEWYVCVIAIVEGNKYLYNSQSSIKNNYSLSISIPIDYFDSAFNNKSFQFIVCLCGDSNASKGWSTLSASSYVNTIFIPLNLDENINAEKTITMAEYKLLVLSGHVAKLISEPSNSQNYYRVQSSIACSDIKTSSETNTFVVQLYINRSGTLIKPSGSKKEFTLSPVTVGRNKVYNFNDSGNGITMTGIPATQSGDKLYLSCHLSYGGQLYEQFNELLKTY